MRGLDTPIVITNPITMPAAVKGVLMRTVIIPAVDADRVFIDHFLEGWELGVLGEVLEISRTTMSRLMKVKHHSISVWAKKRKLPHIDHGCYHGTNYRWVALDGDGRMIAEGNRQATMFQHVIRLLREQGVDVKQYIRGIYAS